MRQNRKMFDLATPSKPDTGFAAAVHRLFGDRPQKGKRFRLANREYIYSGYDKNLVSFVPVQWKEALDKKARVWPGCENWWAGYPLILWIELRLGDNGVTGHLRLNAEVGPVSGHAARKGLLMAIKNAATASGSSRIRLEATAFGEKQRYSRFLRENSIALSDIRNVNEVERTFVQLLAQFEEEFAIITAAIAEYP